jgi:hypothetical protein
MFHHFCCLNFKTEFTFIFQTYLRQARYLLRWMSWQKTKKPSTMSGHDFWSENKLEASNQLWFWLSQRERNKRVISLLIRSLWSKTDNKSLNTSNAIKNDFETLNVSFPEEEAKRKCKNVVRKWNKLNKSFVDIWKIVLVFSALKLN